MRRSVLSIVLALFLLTACGQGPTEPEGFTVEGFVKLTEDGSPIQGVSVTATRTWCKAVDLDFCRNETETYDSAETDSTGYYRLTLPSGCIDILFSKPGYIQSGPYPHVYCTPGNTHPSASSNDGDQRVDLQMSLRDPRLRISGRVTSSLDGAGLGWALVGVYGEIDAEELIAGDATDWAGGYDITLDCEELVYVQARCPENPYEFMCSGWMGSERVPVASDCPSRGSINDVRHRVDFVLDPISE